MYVIRTSRRDALAKFLQERGIGTGIHYPVANHQQPAMTDLYRDLPKLPATEKAVDEILSLPIYGELPLEDVDYVCEAIAEFHRKTMTPEIPKSAWSFPATTKKGTCAAGGYDSCGLGPARDQLTKWSSPTTAAPTSLGPFSANWRRRMPVSGFNGFAYNCGESAASWAGMQTARGRFLVTMDADLQNDPRDLPKFLEALERFDCVCGTRVETRGKGDNFVRIASSRVCQLGPQQAIRRANQRRRMHLPCVPERMHRQH